MFEEAGPETLPAQASTAQELGGVSQLPRDVAIDILLDLASRGEIDPWDVDIVAVTDRFLSALDTLDRSYLMQSARCLFYGAALVHLKARVLRDEDLSGFLPPRDPDTWIEDGLLEDWPATEGSGIVRARRRRMDELPLLFPPDRGRSLRARLRRAQGRPITLHDLIAALESFDQALIEEQGGPVRALRGDAGSLDDGGGFDELDERLATAETAHEDDLETDIATLRDELRGRFDALPGAPLNFDELAGPAGSRVRTFLALLFLSNGGEVDLDQDQLYGPLLLRRGALFGVGRQPGRAKHRARPRAWGLPPAFAALAAALPSAAAGAELVAFLRRSFGRRDALSVHDTRTGLRRSRRLRALFGAS